MNRRPDRRRQPVRGTTVDTFATTDVDDDDSFTYSLQETGGSGSFSDNDAVDRAVLETAASLNFETRSSYPSAFAPPMPAP